MTRPKLICALTAAEYYSKKDPIFDPEDNRPAISRSALFPQVVSTTHRIGYGYAGSGMIEVESEHTHMLIDNNTGEGMTSCFVRELLERYSEEGKQNIVEAINKSAIFCPVK